MVDDATIERLTHRVVELEELITHMQRTIGDLDQVVLAQQNRLELLERRISAVGAELSVVASSVVEERKPEDEKPPHY